jgi:subtilisin family serine protease
MKKVLLVLLLLFLPLTATARSFEPPAHQFIRLQAVTFDPIVTGEPATVREPELAAADNPYFIVQFKGMPSRAALSQAEQLGAQVLGYLPDNAYVARIDSAVLDRVRSLPALRWVGPYRPAYKRAPALAEQARLAADAPIDLSVLGFAGEPAADIAARLVALGATVVEASDTPFGAMLRANLPADQVVRLSAEPAVSWIEPYIQPQLDNAEGRKIIGAESVWQSNTLFGGNQIVAVSDSGLSVQGALNADFGDRLVRAYSPAEMVPSDPDCQTKDDYTDLNGHGTHVAGSVLGNGVNSGGNPAQRQFAGSNAGVAPEARMVFMAMNIDGSNGIQCIPANGNYIAFGYQNGARISSNSWGSNAAGAYTLNSSSVDDYIWRNPDYVVLFSAGNAGPDSRTIGAPGSAKNVITVGASENYRPSLGPEDPFAGGSISDDPNTMAYFSSRGPTADDRVKPDVVAPGTNILSVLGEEAGGYEPAAPNSRYAYSSGTSMATPLSAGAAALVREWLQGERNIPEPSAALIKALMIHGAAPLAAVPNQNSGFGRVDLKNTLNGRYAIFDDYVAGISTGQTVSYTIQIAGGNANGTLFAQPQRNPQAAATMQIQPDARPAAQPQAERGPFVSEAVPGFDTAPAHGGIRDGGAQRNRPFASIQLQPRLSGARSLAAEVASSNTTNDFQQSMVGGGDFEDPFWSLIWSQIWLGAGVPVRTDGSDGGIVIDGDHSIWLGGTASDDAIFYPISFPEQIDDVLATGITFVVQQEDRDIGVDFFCAAVVDASGYVIGRIEYCGDNLPSGPRLYEIVFSAAEVAALEGQTGYLALYTDGDAEEPHMSAFVDNVDLIVDFPPVTLTSTPSAGPAGTVFLLSGSNHVPYGEVVICSPNCDASNGYIGSVYADDRGDALAYLFSDEVAPGAYTIAMENVAGRSASTSITILGAQQPTLAVTPPGAAAGSEFAVSGADFLPNDSEISVLLDGELLGTVGSDVEGAVGFSITTSSNTPPAVYQLTVRDTAGNMAQASYTVTAPGASVPKMSVSPSSGVPGTAFNFSGSGFTASQPVEFLLDDQSLGTVDADEAGMFVVTLNTADTIPPGTYTLEAAQDGKRARATFQITGDGGGTPSSGNGLYITLVWTDPPAQPSAARVLVNNLDLLVQGPGGPYRGNVGTGSTADALNNVESIRLENPAPGTYTVIVQATSVSASYGAQPFALVATTAQNYGTDRTNVGIGNERVYLPLVRR